MRSLMAAPRCGMDGGVERGVGGLEAQEIAVGAGFAPEAELIGRRSPRLRVMASGVSFLMVRMISASHAASMPKSSPDCRTTVPKPSSTAWRAQARISSRDMR